MRLVVDEQTGVVSKSDDSASEAANEYFLIPCGHFTIWLQFNPIVIRDACTICATIHE